MGKATREAYGEELAILVQKDPKIVVLDADLAGSTKTIEAKKVVPERFFDMGVAEADMIGHAAGLAASGYTVFASSFAMFCTGRAWEQIRNSVVYPKLNIKICGTHGGIAVGEDGVSHQAIEDIAIMRAIPGMEVYVPSDAAESKAVIDYVAQTKTPCYVRLGRSKAEDVYEEGKVPDVTKIHVLRKGSDIAIFACGLLVDAACKAADELKEEGIEVTVIDVCCIKPLDEEGVLEILQRHSKIFTAEEHNVVGGLGSAISELAAEKLPRSIHKIGLQDRFAESGPFETLMHEYGLDSEAIKKEIKNCIQK